MKHESAVEVMTTEPQRAGEDLLIGRQIGIGGMGVIREARDPALNRDMAVKLLKPVTPEKPNRRTRFIHEAQIAAQLDHPNILPVYELGENPDHGLFFTMKLVAGETLSEIIASTPLAYRTPRHLYAQLQIFLKVCDAVSFAHSRAVIHRDLKPDNIMVASYGRVYLMDWGVALVRSTLDPDNPPSGRRMVGTPRYMAPEQATGHADLVDERADVFALGAMLYHLLTHQPPYPRKPLKELMPLVQRADIPPPQDVCPVPLPPRLCTTVMKALARNPDERHQSAAEFKDDLELFLQSGWQFPIESYPPGSVIVREGASGGSAYVIMSGRCRAYRGDAQAPRELREMGRGEVFGETAVFSDKPRSATVEAIDQVSVMAISREHFSEDLGLGFWMGLFVRALANRFLEKEQAVLDLERRLEGD